MLTIQIQITTGDDGYPNMSATTSADAGTYNLGEKMLWEGVCEALKKVTIDGHGAEVVEETLTTKDR